MPNDLSLLVIDISEDWEEVLKAHERGHFIEWDHNKGIWSKDSKLSPSNVPLNIQYPHGSTRAGFDAIIDTVRIAHSRDHTIYASSFYNSQTDGEEQPCHSINPYIPQQNRFDKHTYSAFGSGDLATRLKEDGCRHLMVIGYDRDCCVLETVKDAVTQGIQIVTSEHVMLTTDRYDLREGSLAYLKENTIFLDDLESVWNYLIRPLK
ncbi:MAG: isochorismatase family protein [Candidatus Woesearchaeota archaeon]